MVDWLLYHPQHQVLVCRRHGHAVDNLAGHLLRQHRDLALKHRASIVSEYAGVLLGQPASADFDHGPENPIPPVEGLTIHKDGFACREVECGFLTASWKCLRVHFNEAHRRRAMEIHGRWSGVALQTFFTRPRGRVAYFCVATAEAGEREPPVEAARGPTEQRLLKDITARWAHEAEQQEKLQQVFAGGVKKHETTNWLRQTQWSEHFKGRNLVDIASCSRVPGRQITGELGRLSAALDRLFFNRCIGGLKTMPLMTRLLLASPNHSFRV